MPERIHRHFDEDPISSDSAKPLSKKRKQWATNHAYTAAIKAPFTVNHNENPARVDQLEAESPSPSAQSFHKPTVLRTPFSTNKEDAQKVQDNYTASHVRHALGNLKERAKLLWPQRKALPVWSYVEQIRHGLREKDVMLLVGETGSGKSTQVPQILVHEPWSKPQKITTIVDGKSFSVNLGGCIAITEPRRVAAISLARRVADEMGSPLGSSSPASKVGYSVRFDNSTSPSTRIKFLTEGMLLQEILRDPWLRQYSAVVVDEVHERGINVDLVMGFLKNIVAGGKKERNGNSLKVVVMSATADMESILEFFEQRSCITQSNKSRHFNDQSFTLSTDKIDGVDDESEWSGITSSDREDQLNVSNDNESFRTVQRALGRSKKRPKVNSKINPPIAEESLTSSAMIESRGKSQKVLRDVTMCHIIGRQFPVRITYLPEPVQDFVDASLHTIFRIHYGEPMPGDILVFLTGQETVESLESLVNEYALSMKSDVPKILVLPLFAALPQAAQQRVFQPAPPKTRKVIIATNVAETSVTVSGVRFVIDCGKAKVKQYRSRIGLDSLLVKPISKSAAIQRQGRAGREAPGQCFRLYTEKDYFSLESSNTPEILRCDLSQAILTMKARGVKDIASFPFLDSPPRESLEKALLQLFQLKTLNEAGEITDIGMRMAELPLYVCLARALLAAAEPEMDCVSEVIDIISCLSVENVFLNLIAEEKKEEAEVARRELFRREGDHLTLLATVQSYAAENSDRKAWAERHFVSHRAMQAVMVY